MLRPKADISRLVLLFVIPTQATEQPGAGAQAASASDSTSDFSLFGDGSASEQNAEGTNDTLAGSDGLENQQPVELEHEEIEYEGEKFKIPAKLKDAVMRQADYTRKTQAVSERDRQIEAREQTFAQTAQMHGQMLKEIARVTAIDDRLGQLQSVNWQALNVQDPQQAQALHLEFTQLQAQRGQLVGEITQKQGQMQSMQQRAIAQRAEQAEAFLKREIKDWSPEKDRALAVYARQQNIDPQMLGQFTLRNPGIMVALNKAAMFDKILSERKKPATPPAPGTRVNGGNASATKPLSQVTDPREWQKRREERRARNR